VKGKDKLDTNSELKVQHTPAADLPEREEKGETMTESNENLLSGKKLKPSSIEQRAAQIVADAYARGRVHPGQFQRDSVKDAITEALHAVRAEALEEAAKVAEKEFNGWSGHSCVQAIRALKQNGETVTPKAEEDVERCKHGVWMGDACFDCDKE
jgi:hypothetical protein